MIPYIYAGYVIMGLFVAVISAHKWKENRYFHFLPFIYAIFGYLILWRLEPRYRFDWYFVALFGVVFYALGWGSYFEQKQRGKRRR